MVYGKINFSKIGGEIMLQFILGKPSSGKTFTVIKKIKDLTKIGKESILIVPEQFTFESERLILKELGDKASLNVSVLSFTRLYDEVGRNVGGIAGTVLEDADKVIFMSRALNILKDELKLWRRYVSSVSFAKTMLDTVGEFKINAFGCDDLLEAAEEIKNPPLAAKLQEIALIYRQYDMFVGEKFIDTADCLTKLYNTLGNYNFFEGKTVFLDSFKGFTGQQFKIIERIISQAENVYISLTDDVYNNKQFGVYTNIRIAAERIKKFAVSCGKTVAEPIILNKTFYKATALKGLENLMSSGKCVDFTDDGSVIIRKSTDIYDEAEAAARTIRRLVRTKGYRYRDFVIIARDADSCNEAVANACKRNDISCFYDNRLPLSAFPLSVAVEAAIAAIKLNSADILRFNKTGLGYLMPEEISFLENYVYLWNIEGEDWLKVWDMDPRGFTTNPINQIEFTEKLEKLNKLRGLAIKPILNFKKHFGTNAKIMVEAIFTLFDECDFTTKLSNISDKLDNDASDLSLEVMKSAYDQYISILSSMVRCYGEMNITTAVFTEGLSLAVSLASVGVIPQMLDQVTFGSADRIRPSRPKIAFIIGANQGIFPQFTSNNGLFNIIERRNLISAGLNIADNSVYSSVDEEYLVYCNVCCPSDRLYISFSEQTVSGESLEPSAFVRNALDKLCLNLVSDTLEELNEFNAPQTEAAAFTDYCRNKLRSPITALTIAYALEATETGEKINHLKDVTGTIKKCLASDTAKKLYGSNISMSATKFDTYNRCKFSFFCRYGLGAQKLLPAEFNVMQRGTVVHFVLERLISEHGDNISELTNDELDILTEKYINMYLDSVNGYRSTENAKSRFLVSRISRSLKEVIHHIAAELSQSKFKPKACELGIGTENADINVRFPFDEGNISLIGSIDRVDEYNGFIRIIDYKTGSKSFKLPDILFGLNMQMLIYLYAVIRGNGIDDDNAAGILYQPSRRDINDNGMAMNGLLPSVPELFFAMDKKGEGEFVPKLSFNKDGTVSKRSNSFIEKEGFTEIFDYIELLMKNTGNRIIGGDIAISPTDGRESPACKYCDFSSVCGFENNTPEKVPELNNDKVFEKIKEAKINGI